MNEPPILCTGFHLYAQSITTPSLTVRLPCEPDSSVLLLAVAAGAVGLGSAILTLETDGLVDEEVTHARVGGRGDGKGNDDTCENVRDQPYHRRWIAGTDRGGSTREGSCEGASGVARRYELFQWTRRQHGLGPGIFERSSRDVGGRWWVLSSSFNGSRTSLLLLLYRHKTSSVQSLTQLTESLQGSGCSHRQDRHTGTGFIRRAVGRNARRAARVGNMLEWRVVLFVEKSPAQGRFEAGERALEGEGLRLLQFERYGASHQWVGAGARLSHGWSPAGQLQPLASAHGPGEQAQNLPQAVTLCSSSPCHRLGGSNRTESTDSFGDYLTSELSHNTHLPPPITTAIEPPPSLKVALETPNRPTCPTTSALQSPSSSSPVCRPCSSSHAKFPRPGKFTWPDVDGIPVSGRLLTVSTAGMLKIPH